MAERRWKLYSVRNGLEWKKSKPNLILQTPYKFGNCQIRSKLAHELMTGLIQVLCVYNGKSALAVK